MKIWNAIRRRFSPKAVNRRTHVSLIRQHRGVDGQCPVCRTSAPCDEWRRLTGSNR